MRRRRHFFIVLVLLPSQLKCHHSDRQCAWREQSVFAHAAQPSLPQSLGKPPEGILLLASGATEQNSIEDETFGHGVFMHYMLQGLCGQAAI